MSQLPPGVSDHALLRYIERVYGFDLEEVRARMLTPIIAAAIKAGARAVTIDGIKFMVADGMIVTVFENKPWARPKVRKTNRPRGAGREVPRDDTQERLREYGDEA